MNRILYSLFLAGTIASATVECIAQESLLRAMTPKPVPPSPNVAGLGKYGDYQVSHFTGIPDISIPIFEARSGSLTVPITLSYHASGIKPTDIASWVGMGWSLSAGGQISRTINGKPDEQHYLEHPLNTDLNNCTSFQYLRQAADGTSDTEADVFSYSYPGRTGKFLLPNGGTYNPANINMTTTNGGAYLVPYAPIIIKRITTDKYEVTDENGVLYRYGTSKAGVISTEATSATNGGTGVYGTTAWNLMEMSAPNSNDEILFTYRNAGQADRKDVSHVWAVRDQVTITNGAEWPQATHMYPQAPVNIESSVNQEGVFEIKFETGKVEFVLGPLRNDARKLNSLAQIIIYTLENGTYIPQKTIKFLYSYFTNAVAGQQAALKLDEVQFLDNGTSVIQRYKFSYFTNSFSWNPTASTFLNARDLWGYYNGALSNTDLVLRKDISYNYSNNQTTITIGGAYDRKVNAQFVKEGVLKRIDFPTGGYTEFDYESNKYLDTEPNPDVETLAGGLRVTKITSTESSSGTPVVKTYKYGSGESGLGSALFTPYQFNYSGTQLYSSDCPITSPIVTYQMRTYHSNTSYNYDASSPVAYGQVTEYFGDPTGSTNGRIVYVYDVGPMDMDFVLPGTSKYYKNTYAWRRGKLASKKVYGNGLNNLLTETVIDYAPYKQEARIIGIGVYPFLSGNPNCLPGGNCNYQGDIVNSQTYKATTFSQNSGVMLESAVTNYTYEPGNITKYTSTKTTNTYHAEKLQLTQSTKTYSNSTEEAVTVNTYPFQLASANVSSTGAAQGIYALNVKNILTSAIESYTYLQKPNNTNRRVVSGQVTTFKISPTNSSYVVPDQIYALESVNRLSSYLPITINGSNNGVTFNTNQKLRLMMLEYDVFGNIQAFSKTNDVVVSYKWGYKESLPIAEITNTLAKNVFIEGFEEQTANVTIGGKTGKNASSTAGYSKSLTLLEPGSYVLAYYKMGTQWDYYETAVTVPAGGTFQITLPAGRYDEIRLYPKGAQLTTYTYDLLGGMTSMTDANGITTYYEFDTFSRLKLIRDNNSHILKTYDYRYKIMN